jgi:hypothetical protein
LHPNFLAEDERAALLHEQDVEVLVAKIEAAAR